jgi:hypothetical protein
MIGIVGALPLEAEAKRAVFGGAFVVTDRTAGAVGAAKEGSAKIQVGALRALAATGCFFTASSLLDISFATSQRGDRPLMRPKPH